VATVLRSFDGAWEIVSLGGEQAGGDAVRRGLSEGDLFHYAGHAAFVGSGGWDSALPLAGGWLTVGDVLALPKVPRWVFLSGCETGRSGRQAPQEGIGLANAFAAAGSSRVIAAVRPVADATARALVESFYREWSGSTAPSLALQRAQLVLRRDHPEADWSAFRVIEP
jgi:CHAT domain-containing protein